MKRVEWWVAKVYPKKHMPPGENNPIDLWEQFKTEREARAYLKKVDSEDEEEGEENPFDLVKITYETIKR